MSITGRCANDRLRRVNDQHVDFRPPRDVGRNGSQQSAGDRAEADVADDQQVGADFLGETHQRVNRGADNGPLLDMRGAR